MLWKTYMIFGDSETKSLVSLLSHLPMWYMCEYFQLWVHCMYFSSSSISIRHSAALNDFSFVIFWLLGINYIGVRLLITCWLTKEDISYAIRPLGHLPAVVFWYTVSGPMASVQGCVYCYSYNIFSQVLVWKNWPKDTTQISFGGLVSFTSPGGWIMLTCHFDDSRRYCG